MLRPQGQSENKPWRMAGSAVAERPLEPSRDKPNLSRSREAVGACGVWKITALQIIRCTVPHIPRLLNEHFVRVFIFSSPAFSLRPWSQCGQGPVGWRVVFVHGLVLCQTANIFSKNQPQCFLLDHRECSQTYEAQQKSPILLLFDKCFYLEHFVFIPNCINQDQGRGKDRMIHLPKRGWGSNPQAVLFVHNLKKVRAILF